MYKRTKGYAAGGQVKSKGMRKGGVYKSKGMRKGGVYKSKGMRKGGVAKSKGMNKGGPMKSKGYKRGGKVGRKWLTYKATSHISNAGSEKNIRIITKNITVSFFTPWLSLLRRCLVVV